MSNLIGIPFTEADAIVRANGYTLQRSYNNRVAKQTTVSYVTKKRTDAQKFILLTYEWVEKSFGMLGPGNVITAEYKGASL